MTEKILTGVNVGSLFFPVIVMCMVFVFFVFFQNWRETGKGKNNQPVVILEGKGT